MEVIRVTNDFSYLVTENKDLRDKLYQALGFRQRNYFWSNLYKQKLWDGYVRFFNRHNGRFLTGLLPEVKQALEFWKVEYSVLDERIPVQWAYEQIDNQFLNQWLPKGEKPVDLFGFQVDLINQAIKHSRGIIKAPTGAGKTLVMIGIMKALPPNTPTLFLANRKGLVRQNYKEIMKWGFKNVGLFDGDTHDPNIITCATVQSLHHLDKLLPKFKAVIVDEIHMMMGNTAIDTYKKLKGCYVRIAVSATPFKYAQKSKKKSETVEGDKVHKYSVKGYFGPLFKTKQTADGDLTVGYMQDLGRISQSKCTFYNIYEPQIPYEIYLDAVTKGIAQSWHFHQVVKRLTARLKGRTLIMVERLAHGDTLQQLIPGALWVRGEDSNKSREYVIEQLQSSKGDVVAIATTGIFNAGINCRVHTLINCAGGKASHEIAQRIGRGLRESDDKEILDYYDFVFRINKILEDHSKERIKILKAEGHEVTVKDIDF